MQNGKWADPGVPKTGWECTGVEDLEEPRATCEMCEVQIIRYVHTMEHWDYPDTLRCGCICAGYMEEDANAARERDDAMRARAGRKKNWLSRKWSLSRRGNMFLNAGDYNVVVFERGGAWAFRVSNKATDDTLPSRKPYMSREAAMLRAFDAMEWMKEKGR
jgi:hypothetical protein